MGTKVGLHLACHPQVDPTWNFLPPLGLGILAACLKRALPSCEVCIPRHPRDLLDQKPEIVGLSYSTQNGLYAGELAAQLREACGCRVIAGGPHISTLPTHLPAAFDAGVIGEGEQAFTELIRLFDQTGSLPRGELSKIAGIVHRDEGGHVVRTAVRPVITNLDCVPRPDRALMSEGWPAPPGDVHIMTSRGCPYDCTFCNTVRIWGRKLRHTADERILSEMEQVRSDCNPARFHIYDDLFIADRKRAARLMGEMRRRGLHEGVEWTAFVRSSLMDDRMAEEFTATNFKVLNAGFEAGSNAVLDVLGKGPDGEESNERAVALGLKHGLRYASCFIFGSPGETRADIQKTFDFITRNHRAFSHVQFAPLIVLPGTPVWEWARKAGMGEHDLTGIAPMDVDWEDEEHFLLHRWRYLNEASIPRGEFVLLLKVAHHFETLIWNNTLARGRVGELEKACALPERIENIAKTIPLGKIVQAKARRRLQRLMPNDPLHLPGRISLLDATVLNPLPKPPRAGHV